MDYFLCGAAFRMVCQDPRQEPALASILESLFTLLPRAQGEFPNPLELRVTGEPEPAFQGHAAFVSDSVAAYATAEGYHLRAGDSFLSIDFRAHRAKGSFSEAFRSSSLEDQRGILLFALILLLAGRGMYGLHAAGLVWNNVGTLLAGRSGSGKTTLTCALARSGWQWLSDDAVLLRRGQDGPEALAFGRPFHCAPDLFGHFPELGGSGRAQSGGKRLVEVSGIYAGRMRTSIRPRVILFPEIVSSARSTLIPLSPTETMVRLLKDGTGVPQGREAMAAQAAILAELVKTARGYRLRHGADVHSDPARISDLLRKILPEGEAHDTIRSAA